MTTSDVIKGPIHPPLGFGGGSGGRGASRRASMTGLVVLLAASTMVFAAFTSAYVVRRGMSSDWIPIPLPPVCFVNAGILVLSSVLLEVARHKLKTGHRGAFNGYWTAATAFGILFLLGQGLAWRELLRAGIFVATNPSSSFFYLLTASHAVHLLGGITALVYVNVQALRLQLGPVKRTAVDVCSLFWHFLDGLWVYLLVLFLVWG